MKKLFEEFKKFINRGSVMDLAVGMIIGSAFTAIVTALVNGILKPLINAIPGADDTGALQTVLRNPVLDDAGNVIKEAVILDWGGVISAIITFFVTAIVLFLIVKIFNKAKDVAGETKKAIDEKVKRSKHNGEAVEESVEDSSEETAETATTEPTATPETAATDETSATDETPATDETSAAQPTETTEELLRQILAAIKEQNGENK